MNLGTETGSLINHLHSRAVVGQPAPVAGMGATVLGWSDRRAGTVFRVFKVGSRTIVEVRRDRATLISGDAHKFSPIYSYAVNVRGAVDHFRMEADGRWTAVVFKESTSRWIKSGGAGLLLGARDEHFDLSF